MIKIKINYIKRLKKTVYLFFNYVIVEKREVDYEIFNYSNSRFN